jgi:hypothetical protein
MVDDTNDLIHDCIDENPTLPPPPFIEVLNAGPNIPD